jgi:hypothetical protein
LLVPLVAAGVAALLAAGGGGWWWMARSRALQREASARQQAAAAAAAAAIIPAPANALPPPPVEPAPPATPVSTALTNQDVITMVKEKLSPSLIIGQIRSSETKFDLTTAEVIRLAKEGVPERIIEAMRNPKTAPQSERSNTALNRTAPSQAPVVTPAPSSSAAPVTLPPPVAAPVTMAAPPTVTAPPPPVVPGGTVPTHPVNVLGGLPIAITLLADVPAGAESGTPLRFQATQDFRINGVVVVAQGAPVTGELLGAGKKFLRIGGKVQFKLNTVTAVDGQKLRIRATPGRNTEKNEHSIEAPGLKNKELLAPAGTQYVGYVDADQTVAVKR